MSGWLAFGYVALITGDSEQITGYKELTHLMKHTLVDFSTRMDSVKNRELKKYKDKGGYYYCFFIGTLPEAQGKGTCSSYVSLLFRVHMAYRPIRSYD